MIGRIAALYRHPVKGLTPEAVPAALLAAGAHFPCDRIYAVEDGPSGFDPDAPQHLSKQKFAVLARLACLARVRTVYDEATGLLDVHADGHPSLRARLTDERGRAALADWLQAFVGEDARGVLRVLVAPGVHRFMDSRRGFVSVLNLQGVAELERRLGKPVDPLRFRANVHVQGWDIRGEVGSTGRTLRLGDVELEVLSDIDRCAATHVHPDTGDKDIDMVPALFAAYGDIYCGVYARVVQGGTIRPGDEAVLYE